MAEAWAVLFRQKGTDGSLPEHWFPSFQSGDTPTRRNQINVLAPDPQNWEVVECTRADYEQYRYVKFKAQIDQAEAVRATFESAAIKYRNLLKTQPAKVKAFLTNNGLSSDEADALLLAAS